MYASSKYSVEFSHMRNLPKPSLLPNTISAKDRVLVPLDCQIFYTILPTHGFDQPVHPLSDQLVRMNTLDYRDIQY